MALDGIIINSLANSINELIPAKINKLQQISDTEILFSLYAKNTSYKLIVSVHSVYNRLNITKEDYSTPYTPSNFLMVLRKHIEGGNILSFKQLELDRILELTISTRNDLGDIHIKTLYIELMGKYANIILVDSNNKIIDALKRIPPYENNQRTVHPGALFKRVTPHPNTINPLTYSASSTSTISLNEFDGFSPLLIKEIEYRLNNSEDLNTILNLIKDSKKLYISKVNNKVLFHVIPLLHISSIYEEYEIHKGIDTIFFDLQQSDRIKQQSGDLFKFVKRELKRNKSKLLKLEDTINKATKGDIYQYYGDILFAFANNIKEKMSSISLLDFDNKQTTIPLDIRYDCKDNAKRYYKKYHKSKTAMIVVEEQIAITKQSISYFELIEAQLNIANVEDALEIRKELVTNGYLHANSKHVSRKKNNNIPHFLTINYKDNIIYVGKNNIQNDYVTFKQGRKEDMWFHTEGYHGAHVVVVGPLDEEIIRLASMFAAYYSQASESSSIAVNYTQIKNIKKPPKANIGLVIMSTYKTIYIDIDEQLIHKFI
ncbi:MAG: NFACT RNA binding domain-containing protein [Erysipelotrichaceae bacterium]